MAEFARGAGLLVDPHDADGFAEAIVRAAGPEHDGLAQRGRVVAEGHSWADAARLTAAVYREVA